MDYLVWIFRILPSFCLGDGILSLAAEKMYSPIYNDGDELSPFDIRFAGGDILFLILTGIVCTILIFVCEHL